MNINDFDFELPDELIARYPLEERDSSRMMTVERSSGNTKIEQFSTIVNFFESGDAVVLNNTRVIPARIYGRKQGSGGQVEGLLLEERGVGLWQAMLKPGRRLKEGTVVVIDNSDETFVVEERIGDGTFLIRFSTENVLSLLENVGHLPLPPYMNRDEELSDKERYQTVYAEIPGAVAAPTAGLHMTEAVLNALRDKGVHVLYVTLHVGAGTFLPVSVDNIEEHKMHSEFYHLSEDVAEVLKKVRSAGKRICAVGTTSVRTLESCFDREEFLKAGEGRTEIFLYPPHQSRVCDMLLTNFHLPKSTLLMLVSTFADKDHVLAAYAQAVEEKMRFFSYGDCMLFH